mmetsp:Transcript_26361/g.79047  ORF Transcript_26361/g.79047 Transcript_26361/m.79047 type:complete len:195 (-) Transcript_26361:103-687(-)|eukprot:CAMPEP_0119277268 /NCGR_PEP_ID=MMETSP1329-20130426/16859_1 /TAXON_ID=114041 /ORGANISM="Genus nov. species nov., Strain RCC1024" /LENGTH=194 /DNA_ID=CAMNT_0007277733 /DNA_START=182 /DNA_END=766 /DNA_ORIENTATION=+
MEFFCSGFNYTDAPSAAAAEAADPTEGEAAEQPEPRAPGVSADEQKNIDLVVERVAALGASNKAGEGGDSPKRAIAGAAESPTDKPRPRATSSPLSPLSPLIKRAKASSDLWLDTRLPADEPEDEAAPVEPRSPPNYDQTETLLRAAAARRRSSHESMVNGEMARRRSSHEGMRAPHRGRGASEPVTLAPAPAA